MVSRRNIRNCVERGWDGVVPVCEALTCPALSVDSNVLVLGDPEEASFGSVLRFRCRSRKVKCTVPDIENGFVPGNRQEYKEDDILDYQCREGYGRIDFRSSTCTKVGVRAEWSPTPICEQVKCKRRDYNNAQIIGERHREYGYGAEVNYVCKDGFTGGFTLTCGQDDWIGDLNCEACRKPKVEHGFLVGPYNNMLYYTCEQGYKLMAKGWWGVTKCDSQEAVAQCIAIAKHCDFPPIIENAVPEEVYQTKYLSGSEITYQCRNHYTMKGSPTIKCINGTWEDGNITCTPVSCAPPAVADDIRVQGLPDEGVLIRPGHSLTFSCDQPKILKGSKKLKCGNSGQWNHPIPSCEVVSCAPPAVADDIRVQGLPDEGVLMIPGHSLTFSCDQPKVLEGSKKLTCGNNGQWDHPVPSCEACSKLPDVPHANVQYKEGDMVHFTCEPGYSSAQDSKYMCTSNGWLTLSQGKCF
ncbi:hypothetical protein INR49_000659 [Caranx melampygus]|nr:hypothetical protein INR49_000659 [Caranx melampygus]